MIYQPCLCGLWSPPWCFTIGNDFVGEPARRPFRFSVPALPSRHYPTGLNLGLNHVVSEHVSDGYIDIYGYLADRDNLHYYMLF